MAFIVNPLKDFMIAMSFTLLYFYQGKSEQKGSHRLGLSETFVRSGLNNSNELDIKSDTESKNPYCDI